MKKFNLIAFAAFTLFSSEAVGQIHKIGNLNSQGIYSLTITQQQGKDILKTYSIPAEAQPFEATDISITEMPDGGLCLTGYLKNPGGHIIKGFRIVCDQDDENNLIVTPKNKRDRVNGKPF